MDPTMGAAVPSGSLRLLTKVARLYYAHRLGEAAIAERLYLPQARVVQLLAQAKAHGVVRTVVAAPGAAVPALDGR